LRGGKSCGGHRRPIPQRPCAAAVMNDQCPGIRTAGFSASSGT
jgi:hypothetical protein